MTAALHLQLDSLPSDRLYAPDQDMWVRLEPDGTATIGATHLVTQHGQFMFFSPRPVGTSVKLDRSLGVMETAKTAVAIHTPLSCAVLAANTAVESDAGLVTRDPYGEGWLFRVRPTEFAEEQALLLDAAAYRAWLAPRLDRFRPPVQDDADGVYDPRRWL
jgi:glycine cleavage system H protein